MGFDNSPLPEEYLGLPRITRFVGTPQLPPSLKSSQSAVFPDDHFKIPQLGSPGGRLFGKINRHQNLEFKGLR